MNNIIQTLDIKFSGSDMIIKFKTNHSEVIGSEIQGYRQIDDIIENTSIVIIDYVIFKDIPEFIKFISENKEITCIINFTNEQGDITTIEYNNVNLLEKSQGCRVDSIMPFGQIKFSYTN